MNQVRHSCSLFLVSTCQPAVPLALPSCTCLLQALLTRQGCGRCPWNAWRGAGLSAEGQSWGSWALAQGYFVLICTSFGEWRQLLCSHWAQCWLLGRGCTVTQLPTQHPCTHPSIPCEGLYLPCVLGLRRLGRYWVDSVKSLAFEGTVFSHSALKCYLTCWGTAMPCYSCLSFPLLVFRAECEPRKSP